MQKKAIKYSLSALLILFLGYHSVYFKKLDEVKAGDSSKVFDAAAYARALYDDKLLPRLSGAIGLGELISLLKTEPEKAFQDHSRALGIGNIRYFLVQGEGAITSVDPVVAAIGLKNAPAGTDIRIATEFVYGNAIRDASGLVSLNEFSSSSDLNSISEELNKIIREEVLPPFREAAKPGDLVRFSGAIELNQAHLNLDSIEVIPIRLSLLK